jgi:hypothetical protein
MQKFLGVLKIFLPLEQLPEPGKSLNVADLKLFPFFVAPVGRDTFLGNPMHFMGANLNLDPLAVRSNHARMQRLIHIELGQGDIVLETSGHRAPLGMHHAERFVTLALGID